MTELDPADLKRILARMRRAHGHFGSVIRMLEDGAGCEDVLTQLAAVNKAVARSGYAIVASGLRESLRNEDEATSGDGESRAADIEKLFLALA